MWCFIDGLNLHKNTRSTVTGGQKKFFSSNSCGHAKHLSCSSSVTFIFCSVFHISYEKDAKNFIHFHVTLK